MNEIVGGIDSRACGADALAVEYVGAHDRSSCRRCTHCLGAANRTADLMSRRFERFQQMATDVAARTD